MRKAMQALALLPLVLGPTGARASCGLEHCPAGPAPGLTTPDWAFHARAAVRHTSFDLDDTHGDYTEYGARLDRALGRRLILRLSADIVTVRTGGSRTSGAANPVLLAQFHAIGTASGGLSLGTQWEAPWGDDVVSDDHHELLGYGTYEWRRGRWGIRGTAGYRQALTAAEAHHEAGPAGAPRVPGTAGVSLHNDHGTSSESGFPSLSRFVTPHEDRELLWRIGTAPRWGGLLELDGQYVLRGEGEGTHYLTAELSVPVTVGGTRISPSVSGPVSAGRRYDWRVGVGFLFF